MAYKYDSHLSLKSGVFYFVKRVPSDLIHHTDHHGLAIRCVLVQLGWLPLEPE